MADVPAKPLLACDDSGTKYLLSPAIIEGTQLDDASFGHPAERRQYVVNLDFNGDAHRRLRRRHPRDQRHQRAVRDRARRDRALRPVVNSPITDGNAQISGNFTAKTAESLANSLKYGALPLKFDVPVVERGGADPGRRPALRRSPRPAPSGCSS